MKKSILFGLVALVGTAMLPSEAMGQSKTVFSADNVLVPASRWTPDEVWKAQAYIVNSGKKYDGPQGFDNPEYNHIWGVPKDDSKGNKWYSVEYTLTDGESTWTEMESPFNTDKWIESDVMGDIYLRRTFTLDEVPGGSIYLACGRDDAPSEWYINGVLVHSEEEGWNEDALLLLNAEQKSLLKKGNNVFAVHVHQNWGGAFADCGLYEANEQYDLLIQKSDGWWPCYYKTLGNNNDIETAVANGCFNNNAEDGTWTIALGPFGNNDDQTVRWGFRQTFWNSDANPILVRRHFNLTEANATALKNNGDVTLSISYDEWPAVYLNGKLIWSLEPEYNDEGEISNVGWNDGNYATIKLTKEMLANLKGGDNVIGVSARQGGGGGHIDLALYTTLPCAGFTTSEPADVAFYKTLIEKLITESEGLKYSTIAIKEAVEAGKELAGSSDSKALRDAFYNLYTALNGVKNAQSDIEAFEATYEIFQDETAKKMFDTASTTDEFAKALSALRWARRASVAPTHPDVFKGSKDAEGEFYLYNVGKKQFLQGGSDWGAHAALGLPGIELTLETATESQNIYAEEGVNAYVIKTGLVNGQDGEGRDKEYLGYRGYMDSDYAAGMGGWAFIPVEGKENVYYIAQADYENAFVMWNPFGPVDNHMADETNVCTEQHEDYEGNPNAMWKLVTKAERDALLEKASLENPADATYYMVSPNFNQRENANGWTYSGFSIWARGGNYSDFVAESYDTEECDLNQMVYDLPGGVYKVSVQGYYRNSTHAPGDQVLRSEVEGEEDQLSLGVLYAPKVDNAFLYAGDDFNDDTALPYILTEANKCPYEGRTVVDAEGNEYNIPGGVDQNAAYQATSFFKMGLYNCYTVIKLDEGVDLTMGVYKGGEFGEVFDRDMGDWIVVDNFRLTYYGNETTKEEVRAAIEAAADKDGVDTIEATPVYDGRIYNIHGIEVKNPSAPGIYIQNGKKFVITK